MTMCSPRAPISRSSVSGSFPLVSGLLVGQDLLPGRRCRSGVCVPRAPQREVDAPVRGRSLDVLGSSRRGSAARPAPATVAASSPRVRGGAGLEGLRDHPGRGASSVMVGVPGAEGDAVEVADGRDDAELRARGRDHGSGGRGVRLLRVLASEVGDVWPDDVEELQADGRHAARNCRPRSSRAAARSSPRPTSGIRRVHLLDRRDEKVVDPPAGRKACVPLLVARVAGEVLPALRTGRG